MDAVVTQLAIGGEHEICIGHGPGPLCIQPQQGRELVAVVQPAVPGNPIPAGAVASREEFPLGLRRAGQIHMSECDAWRLPETRLPFAAVRDRRQLCTRELPVEPAARRATLWP